MQRVRNRNSITGANRMKITITVKTEVGDKKIEKELNVEIPENDLLTPNQSERYEAAQKVTNLIATAVIKAMCPR